MTTRQCSGRHFLQIPGPTNVPDRILRAMDRPTIDHRGPEFARLAAGILEDLKPVFRTAGPVVIYPSSGTGASIDVRGASGPLDYDPDTEETSAPIQLWAIQPDVEAPTGFAFVELDRIDPGG